MTRKRFVKLLMGRIGFSRNDANKIAWLFVANWGRHWVPEDKMREEKEKSNE